MKQNSKQFVRKSWSKFHQEDGNTCPLAPISSWVDAGNWQYNVVKFLSRKSCQHSILIVIHTAFIIKVKPWLLECLLSQVLQNENYYHRLHATSSLLSSTLSQFSSSSTLIITLVLHYYVSWFHANCWYLYETEDECFVERCAFIGPDLLHSGINHFPDVAHSILLQMEWWFLSL